MNVSYFTIPKYDEALNRVSENTQYKNKGTDHGNLDVLFKYCHEKSTNLTTQTLTHQTNIYKATQ